MGKGDLSEQARKEPELTKKHLLDANPVPYLPPVGTGGGKFPHKKTSGETKEESTKKERESAPYEPSDETHDQQPTKANRLKLEAEAETVAANCDAYYDQDRKEYVLAVNSTLYQSRTETQFRCELRFRGLSGKRIPTREYSQIDVALRWLREHKYVCYVGSLAGYKIGPYEINGRRVLVTDSPILIEPNPGPFPTINNFFLGMLGSEQFIIVKAWLKNLYQGLREGKCRTGQVLVLAGPSDCGKSLAQNYVFTPIIGGRSVKAYSVMSGAKQFNAHLFAAEHWMIEDDVPSTELRQRRIFCSFLKQAAGNEKLLCEAKYRTPVELSPARRVSISCNDNPEDLIILPPIDESIRDKIILLKTNRSAFEWPESEEEREKLRQLLTSELPGFVDHLLSWKVPEEIRAKRFGLVTYQNPDLLEALEGKRLTNCTVKARRLRRETLDALPHALCHRRVNQRIRASSPIHQ